MRFIADFHIHSHYSRATAKTMDIVSLSRWGQLKGIQVMGTGDCTHPQWLQELETNLVPAETGLFVLRTDLQQQVAQQVPKSCQTITRFILSVEISCIYKKNDRVRKMHCLVLFPTFKAVKQFNAALTALGCNIKSDGRPIIGLDAKRLLALAFEADPTAMFIPAHVWTPHFSVFGSRSGFDDITEAFENLTDQITALETGLSSDPLMNAQWSAIDRWALVSNSDAHSPQKLGREANIFDTDLSYAAIRTALSTNNPKTFIETIEFFPEEGKYHLDGHRACTVRLEPQESKKKKLLCPKCGQPLTIGVLHRISDLADRPARTLKQLHRPFRSIIPLPEMLAELANSGVASKKVQQRYHQLLTEYGNEFSILLDLDVAHLALSVPDLAEALTRMRQGKVLIQAGYDGEFGKISVRTKTLSTNQAKLF